MTADRSRHRLACNGHMSYVPPLRLPYVSGGASFNVPRALVGVFQPQRPCTKHKAMLVRAIQLRTIQYGRNIGMGPRSLSARARFLNALFAQGSHDVNR